MYIMVFKPHFSYQTSQIQVMDSHEVLSGSLATILYVRGIFDDGAFEERDTPDGIQYMQFSDLEVDLGVKMMVDWIVSMNLADCYPIVS